MSRKNTVTVTEVSGGFYRLTFATAPTKDVLVKVDGGAGLTTTRYAALEVPVGGYPDSIDVATSTRATQTAVTALGSPAQAVALAALVTAVGTPAQASALAALVSTVGTPAQSAALAALVATVGSPAQAVALTAAVVTVLAEVDTRATPADVTLTVNPAPTIQTGP